MDLNSLEEQLTGKQFGELILHHHDSMDLQTTMSALQETVVQLPLPAQAVVEPWIDEMNPMALSQEFWTQDAGAALRDITSRAETNLLEAGIKPTSDDLFNMFQIIVINFTYATHRSNESKRFIQMAVGAGSGFWFYKIISSPVIISSVIFCLGYSRGKPYLWLPLAGILSGLVRYYTIDWATSNKLGSAQGISIFLKIIFQLNGLFSMICSLLNVLLVLYWILYLGL